MLTTTEAVLEARAKILLLEESPAAWLRQTPKPEEIGSLFALLTAQVDEARAAKLLLQALEQANRLAEFESACSRTARMLKGAVSGSQ